MRCDVCSKEGAQVQRVTRAYGRGGQELLIRNVPVVTCPQCGESYLTAETLYEIERIKTAPVRPCGENANRGC
jgi:YgiT-type zinc finger domain-containing protein